MTLVAVGGQLRRSAASLRCEDATCGFFQSLNEFHSSQGDDLCACIAGFSRHRLRLRLRKEILSSFGNSIAVSTARCPGPDRGVRYGNERRHWTSDTPRPGLPCAREPDSVRYSAKLSTGASDPAGKSKNVLANDLRTCGLRSNT